MRVVPQIATSCDKDKGQSMDMFPPAPPPNVGPSSCSGPAYTDSLFTPYEPPMHYVAHLAVEASRSKTNQQEHMVHELPQAKKMDPYEEEEVEKALLRSLSLVKKDEPIEAVDFLNSFLPNVKIEERSMVFPSTPRQDSRSTTLATSGFDDYRPSADLLDLFSTLSPEFSGGEGSSMDVIVKSEVFDTVFRHDGDPSSDHKDVIVKSEVVETSLAHDEEYYPSDELLAAFSNLPDATRCDEQPIKIKEEPRGSDTKPFDLRVKEEPTEIQLPRSISSFSELKQQPGSDSTSRTTVDPPRHSMSDNARYHSNVQIKSEPVDGPKMFSLPNRHHSIPHGHPLHPPEYHSNFQSSRDPRKHHIPAALPAKHVRYMDHTDAEEEGSDMLFRKRLKMEQ